MYWITRLLAYVGILRVVDLMYNDGKIRQGEIVDENREHFCIKTFQMWGFYGRCFCDWVLKSDPAIRGIRWNLRAKVALTVVLYLMIASPYVLVYKMTIPNYGVTEMDTIMGLPVTGHIFYPDRLPDGHYTVAKVTPRGDAAIIVRHQPGPYRDFVYYVSMSVDDNVPDDCRNGQRFTVFRGEVT